MKIEFLYFEGCANYKPALKRLKKILAEEDVDFPVIMVDVDSDKMAEELMFPGSPTIRINGKDIEETGDDFSAGFGGRCRVYNDNGILKGVPSEELIKNAIRCNLTN